MILRELLNNLSIAMALALIYWIVVSNLTVRTRASRLLLGILFGLACVLVMSTPLQFSEGVVFDTRSIFLGVAGAVGGPLTGLVAGGIAAAFRLSLGGTGAGPGALVVFLSTGLGVICHLTTSSRGKPLRWWHLYILGVAVHGAMLAAMLTLPEELRWRALEFVALPVMLIFPPATMFIGVIVLDIDKRRRMEVEQSESKGRLAQSETKLRNLFESMHQGVVYQASDGAIIEANEAACRILGLDESQIMGRTSMDPRWRSIREDHSPFPGDQHPAMVALATGECVSDVVMGIYNPLWEGIKWISISSVPEFHPDEDKPFRVFTTFDDITELKLSQEEIRLHKERLLAAQKVGRIGSWEFDIRNNEIWGSDEGFRIYGMDPGTGELPIDEIEACIPEREMVHQALEDLLAFEKPYDLEFDINPADGSPTRRIRSIARLVKDEGGKPLKVVGVIEDVTERRAAEAHQASLEAQLLQAQKMEAIGRLAGGVAHDFNNILTAIAGNIALAQYDLDPQSPVHQYLRDIDHAATRAASLTRQLLAFGRRQMMEQKTFELGGLIENLKRMLDRLLGENINVVLELSQEKLGVSADPGQLEQVLINLCVNARDAMPKGGTITIKTGSYELTPGSLDWEPDLTPGAYVFFSVRDTGTGMDPETLSQIFEPFFTTKPKEKGSGLGLSTCFGIVKQHGGSIRVTSRPGEGSEFIVLFEKKTLEGNQELHPRPLDTPPSGDGKGIILIVEDDPMVAALLQTTLLKMGYQVLCAASGEVALELAGPRLAQLDLLLSDLVLPGISGMELAELLRARRPDLKVLFTSGYSESVPSTDQSTGLYFIGKPYTPSSLSRKLREVVHGETSPKTS